jgi:hypothetical protein
VFGFMNARIQTWFPFSIQICLNGREWLARQMDQVGLGYAQRDNCFVWLEDPERAQSLIKQQLQSPWPGLLDDLAGALTPCHDAMFARFPVDYYCSRANGRPTSCSATLGRWRGFIRSWCITVW